jgi:drug/metabolite transporter (DMT)-like permease
MKSATPWPPEPDLLAPSNTPERRGTALMIAGGLILGTIGIFVEEAHQDPMTTVFFRCFFGMLALSLWGVATGRLHELKLRWRELTVALGAGVLIVLNWVLFFAAIPRVSIAIATVLFHIQPFFVIGLGAWWLDERVSKEQVIACVVALAGLVLATGLIGSNSMMMSRLYGNSPSITSRLPPRARNLPPYASIVAGAFARY